VKERRILNYFLIIAAAYERCFQDWIKRWHMCVASNGDYFE
ncbi:hypothetical protein EAI_07925, partial [Harpegnathos saltator]